MPQSPSPHDMRGLIGNTLRIGVSAACLVAFIGGVLYLFQHGAEQLPDYSPLTYGAASSPAFSVSPLSAGYRRACSFCS